MPQQKTAYGDEQLTRQTGRQSVRQCTLSDDQWPMSQGDWAIRNKQWAKWCAMVDGLWACAGKQKRNGDLHFPISWTIKACWQHIVPMLSTERREMSHGGSAMCPVHEQRGMSYEHCCKRKQNNLAQRPSALRKSVRQTYIHTIQHMCIYYLYTHTCVYLMYIQYIYILYIYV